MYQRSLHWENKLCRLAVGSSFCYRLALLWVQWSTKSQLESRYDKHVGVYFLKTTKIINLIEYWRT